MPPRAITFDVGGTLIQPWPSVGHVYAEVAERFGCKGISPDWLNVQFAAAWKRRHAFDYSRAEWLGLVKETFSGQIGGTITERFFDALYVRFAQPDAWKIFDDVLPTLRELRNRGIRLAVISNWDERLRPLLGALKLESWFDVLAISHETGRTKPAREIFQQTAYALRLEPQAILHVGDSRHEDFHGAQAAGFTARLLNRASSSQGTDEINSLAALVDLFDTR